MALLLLFQLHSIKKATTMSDNKEQVKSDSAKYLVVKDYKSGKGTHQPSIKAMHDEVDLETVALVVYRQYHPHKDYFQIIEVHDNLDIMDQIWEKIEEPLTRLSWSDRTKQLHITFNDGLEIEEEEEPNSTYIFARVKEGQLTAAIWFLLA